MKPLNTATSRHQEYFSTSLKHKFFILLAFSLFGLLLDCVNNTASDEISDTQKLTALKNVSVGYDSAAITPSFPFSLTNPPSIADIHGADSAKYRDLSQYSFTLGLYLAADNKKSGAKDAAIQGLECKETFDTINSQPVTLTSGPKDLPAGERTPIPLAASFTLASHRIAGKYIITQMVAGDSLKIKTQPILLYKFGSLEGALNDLPSITNYVPTRLSNESKTFLKGLLDAGVFE